MDLYKDDIMRKWVIGFFARVFAIFLIVYLIPGIGWSATTSGELPGNETWSGTVSLTGDVTVPVGVALTIAPGTEVVFPAGEDDTAGGEESGLTELIVNGSLSAVGTDGSRIIFKSDAPLFPEKGDWGGIRATRDLGPQAFDMQYCVVSHSASGIGWHVQASAAHSATISNCIVEETSGTAINVSGNSGADITITANNNTIRNGDGHGMYFYTVDAGSTMTATVSGNTVIDSAGYGILVYAYTNATGTLTLTGNTVSGSGDAGVRIRTYNSATSNLTITDNVLTGNGADTGSSDTSVTVCTCGRITARPEHVSG